MSSTQQLLLGEGAGGSIPVYIEDVFSTWLYTGNGSTQSIVNGIDLATKGGLLWIKCRSNASNHALFNSANGANFQQYSNLTAGGDERSGNAFNSNGFTIGTAGGSFQTNDTGGTYVSWTFRKQPKFFDIVTYTGNDVAGRTISHNLGSAPGTIIIKRTNSSSNWAVYHRSLGATQAIFLNSTDAPVTSAAYWNNTEPTSTVFSIGDTGAVNEGGASAGTYVAYLFAHDAGGFGTSGTDNVISCGSFTTSGSGIATVTLGYEPQWVLIKRTDGTSEWHMLDNIRGFSQTIDAWLRANSTAAENFTYTIATPTATGFVTDGTNIIDPSSSFIYIAIRRGLMKVPTLGTNVFATALGVATIPNMVAGFPVDSFLGGDTNTPTSTNWKWWDRLRGNIASLLTTTSAAEDTSETNYNQFQSMTGFISGNYDASDKIGWMFRRAPGYFDEVCYTGTGSNRTITHNLAAVPELMIVKQRGGASGWLVYAAGMGNTKAMRLNSTQAQEVGSDFWNNTTPTSTVFSLGNNGDVNQNTGTYIWYGFATCAGVSKVGSYTGTASTQTINCGFTSGARFVLIKRYDSTGDWYVWDSARGITAGNDPYLLLNSTAVEVTGTDYVDTYSAGFEISSTAPAAINASGGTFIFLAIA